MAGWIELARRISGFGEIRAWSGVQIWEIFVLQCDIQAVVAAGFSCRGPSTLSPCALEITAAACMHPAHPNGSPARRWCGVLCNARLAPITSQWDQQGVAMIRNRDSWSQQGAPLRSSAYASDSGRHRLKRGGVRGLSDGEERPVPCIPRWARDHAFSWLYAGHRGIGHGRHKRLRSL